MTEHENNVAQELFKKYKKPLVNYCIRKYNRSEADSEEFVSEVFFRLSRSISHVADRHPAEQHAWLFSTLSYVIAEDIKKNKHIAKGEANVIEFHIQNKNEYERIIEILTYEKIINEIKNRLKDNDKYYFEKFIQKEYTYKEISETDGINYNTFKSQMRRLTPCIRKIALEVINEHKIEISRYENSKSKK